MKTQKISKLTICSVFLLVSVFSNAQTSEMLFDRPVFYESEKTPEMVYAKWFSVGEKPAWDFLALRFEEKKVVQVFGYKLKYVVNDTTYYVIQDTLPPLDTSDELMQYFITPVDSNGNAGESSEIALISGFRSERTRFTSTKARRLETESGIILNWELNNINDFKYINIYRSVFPNKNFELVSTVSNTEISFADRETAVDLVYYYQLEAVPVTNNKSITSNVIFSAAFNPQPPVSPYIISSNPLRGGAILTIHVTDEEAAGVRIYRDDGINPTMILISDLIPKTDTSLIVFYDTLSLLSGRRTYTYAAKTESTSFVESDFSNKVYVRPIIIDPPDFPRTIEAFEEVGLVKLFWEDVEARDVGLAGYIISRTDGTSKLKEFTSLVPENQLLNVNSFTDSTALPGKVYSYVVQTIDIDGNISLAGAVTTIALQADVPVAPFGLIAFQTENGIRLEWSQSIYEGIASVNLYRYQSGFEAQLLSKLPWDAYEYLDETAVRGTRYFYYLTTTNKAGSESEPSDEIEFYW
jgi:fibronectin type 3 domain-containing protein